MDKLVQDRINKIIDPHSDEKEFQTALKEMLSSLDENVLSNNVDNHS